MRNGGRLSLVSVPLLVGCVSLSAPSRKAGERGPVILVRAGLARATIVTPDVPSASESLAAERVRHYIERMSGARLNIAVESRCRAETRLYIGRVAASVGLRAALKERGASAEASVIAAREGHIHVVGIDDMGTLHAAYFFLEDLGCRWYFPFEWGVVVPRRADVSVPGGETYREPDFQIRTGLWGVTTRVADQSSGHAAAWEWGRGNHLSNHCWWGAGHSYNHLVHPANFKERPDWFALHGGKRHPRQLCTTHPDVRRQALDKVLKALRGPGGDAYKLVCISPNDGHGFCTCENCRALIPDSSKRPDGSLAGPDSDFIDRMVEFANHIADGIREEFPGVSVTYYTDYHSFGTPKLVTPAPNTVFWLVQWAQDQFHGIGDNSKMAQAIRNWKQFGNPLFARVYYSGWHAWTLWPQVHAIRHDIPYFKEHGFIGLYSETHNHWATQHLNFIVFPRLLWDTTTDVDAFVDEFCRTFYGRGGVWMRKFYDLLERTAEEGPEQPCWHRQLIPVFNKPELLERLHGYIDLAQDAVGGQDEVYGIRLRFVETGFRVVEDFFRVLRLTDRYAETGDDVVRGRIVDLIEGIRQTVNDPEHRGCLFRPLMVTPHLTDALKALDRIDREASRPEPELWPAGAVDHYTIDVGAAGDDTFAKSWHAPEPASEWKDKGRKRWSRGASLVYLPVVPNRGYELSVDLYLPPYAVDEANGLYVDDARLCGLPAEAGVSVVRTALPAGGKGMRVLEVRTKTWLPAEAHEAWRNDPRSLGICVRRVTMVRSGSAGKCFDANRACWQE